MSKVDIIRAWRDEEYRASLSPEEQALVPEHPAGAIELDETDLQQVAGAGSNAVGTAGCCEKPATLGMYCLTLLNLLGCLVTYTPPLVTDV